MLDRQIEPRGFRPPAADAAGLRELAPFTENARGQRRAGLRGERTADLPVSQ